MGIYIHDFEVSFADDVSEAGKTPPAALPPHILDPTSPMNSLCKFITNFH